MNYTIYNEDCLIQLKELEDNSIDAIVTDPPYEISFMSKGWDGTGIAFNTEVWEECLRVLKPGGHILAFGGTRTYHRMTVAIEDAGFEIRDCIFWCYGSGFPKSHDVGKNIEKLKVGGKKNLKQIGTKKGLVATNHNDKAKTTNPSGFSYRTNNKGYSEVATDRTQTNGEIPVYEITNDYKGWGTALKPAVEPVVMGRKPFKGSVAGNVLEWGTGGINIDGCRIGTEQIQQRQYDRTQEHANQYGNGSKRESNGVITETQGRFPANLILDEEAGKILDEQSGTVRMASNVNGIAHHSKMNFTPGEESKVKMKQVNVAEIKGGASRFFYCPKTSKKERNEGCGKLEEKMTSSGQKKFIGSNFESVAVVKGKNHHPTVKPCSLLQYLIRLITPKGGVVLDPFMGSGSTGKAAMKEGMDFIGIEKETEYFEIAQARIEWEKNQNNHTKFFDV